MRKQLQFVVLTLLFSLVSSVEAAFDEGSCWSNQSIACCEDNEECCGTFSVEAQYAAFFSLDSDVRSIYGNALPAFTLEGDWRCDCWGIWLDGSYVFGNGHAICSDNKTHLSFVPITLGFKYFFPICSSTELYVGLGASYSFLNIRDHSSFVHEKVSANNSGAILKTGFIYQSCDCFFIEGFFNYLYQKFYFSKTECDPFVYRHDANLSALELGVGIGMRF